jgi:hypothetical protein
MALVAWGCGEAAGGPRALRRDSAGVQIIENRPASVAAACSVSAQPDLDIGAAEGDSAYQFYRTFDGTVLPDGRLAVVNQGSDQIRIYDSTGRFQSAFGREGGGPGEFRRVFQLIPGGGDTLIVVDYRPWRYQFFLTDGSFIRSVEPQPMYVNTPASFSRLADGTYIHAEEVHGLEGPGFQPVNVHVVRHAVDGTLLDSLGVYPGGRQGWLSQELRLRGSPLFEAGTRITASSDRIFAGYAVRSEVEVRSAEWRLLSLIRWRDEDRKISSDEIEAYRKKQLATATSPEMMRFVEPLIAESRPVADEFPAFGSIVVARSGELWIRQYRRPTHTGAYRWWVFDSDGEFLCHGTTPEVFGDFGLWEIGEDYVLGMARDEMEVEHVRKYALWKPDRTR